MIKNAGISDHLIKLRAKQLGIRDFRGVFSRDKLPLISGKIPDGGYIINLQGYNQGDRKGTHWTSFLKKDGTTQYFDPYGVDPPIEVIHGSNRLVSNRKDFQDLNSEECGYWALLSLYFLSKGYSIHQIDNMFYTKDEKGRKLNRKLLSDFFANHTK